MDLWEQDKVKLTGKAQTLSQMRTSAKDRVKVNSSERSQTIFNLTSGRATAQEPLTSLRKS